MYEYNIHYRLLTGYVETREYISTNHYTKSVNLKLCEYLYK